MATRHDGRKRDNVRDIAITFDGLARVDGSARFSFGDTVALASVSGPIEVHLAAELPSQATFDVLVRPLSNIPATEAKSVAATIRSTLAPSLILTKNPRTLIQLVIQCLSAPRTPRWKEGLTAAMINASTLALLDSGSIPMRGVVCAVAVGKVSKGTLVVDPSDEEAGALVGGGCFAFLAAEEIRLEGLKFDSVWTNWRCKAGGFDEDELSAARDLARCAAMDVYAAMKAQVPSMGFTRDTRATAIEDRRRPGIRSKGQGDSDDDKMEI